MATCCLSLLIVSMDATIVNVAIPSIRSDFDATSSQLQWVIDVYTLVLASLLLLSGTMADRFGRRRVFQIGLSTFALGSLLCSLAPTIEVLIAARFLQAVGGSMLNPVAMSIITQTFSGRVERARAVGVWGAVVGISMALGPMVGGLLIDSFSWESVFWVNLPICLIALVATALVVPESKSSKVRGLDPIGQGLAIVSMVGIIVGLIEGPGLGWSDPRTIAIFTVGIVAGVAFCRYELRRDEPFIELRFFRSIPFASATVIGVFAFAAYGAFLFMMSIYLQSIRDYSPVQTGLMFLPIAAGTLVFSPLSGRLVGKYGTRPSLVVAGLLLAVASAALTQLGQFTPNWQLLAVFGLFGIGFGMVNPPITTAAVSGMPRDRAGAASAIASTSRQVGISLGVALSGTLAGSVIAADANSAGAVGDMAPLWWVAVGLALGIAALGFYSTTATSASTTKRVATLFAESDEEPIVQPTVARRARGSSDE
ncbi:EmrB/QacA subfamily drug resistance transporter [Williamsia limnetica]|uniref:EmrB/QacA subfamily drug resistance transporter n=1 Tax=Williamsia limnetica TaxID=882452 RepID=A0A318RI94_WILLI|nr:EmrB/QacA subfamily drug resistance transporter [Williamsia limnetica]